MNATHRLGSWRFGTSLCAALLLVTTLSVAQDNSQAKTIVSNSQQAADRNALQRRPSKYQFQLTANDLDVIIAQHRSYASDSHATKLEEVIVEQQDELLPLRSPTREVWGGLAAPFWAIAHPTQAWRILMPIPD